MRATGANASFRCMGTFQFLNFRVAPAGECSTSVLRNVSLPKLKGGCFQEKAIGEEGHQTPFFAFFWREEANKKVDKKSETPPFGQIRQTWGVKGKPSRRHRWDSESSRATPAVGKH